MPVISPSMLIIAVALVAPGCQKSEPATTKQAAPAKALPGTEAVQKLLSGVGKSATPSSGTALALGDILGKAGTVGGGPARGMGLAGGTTPVKSGPGAGDPVGPRDDDPTAKPVDPDNADVASPPATTAVDIKLPPAQAAGGDCTAVSSRVAAIMIAAGEAQLGDDAEARKIAEPMLRDAATAVRTEIDKQCTAQAWPQNLKDCLLTASDAASLQGCERFATQAMKDAAAGAAPTLVAERPTTPAPKWTGGHDCSAAGAHTAAILDWELSVAPPDVRASAADLVAQLKAGVELQCTSTPWPDDVRKCVVAAGSMDELNACSAKL